VQFRKSQEEKAAAQSEEGNGGKKNRVSIQKKKRGTLKDAVERNVMGKKKQGSSSKKVSPERKF